MTNVDLDKIIYQLTVEDLQNAADDILDRKLSEKEIAVLEEKIGDYINWYDLIQSAIIQNIK